MFVAPAVIEFEFDAIEVFDYATKLAFVQVTVNLMCMYALRLTSAQPEVFGKVHWWVVR